MGNCGTTPHSSTRKLYQQPPQDVHRFDRNSPDRKVYDCILGNIRVQNLCDNLVKTDIELQFSIEQAFEASLVNERTKQNKTDVKLNLLQWNFTKQFKLFLNDYEIRTKNLKILIKNQDSHKSYEIRINLYRILSGPFHHDFEISKKGKSLGRLVFDLKIAEIVDIDIDILTTQITLNQGYPGETFNFLIQSHANSTVVIDLSKSRQRREIKSIPSYKKCLPIDPSEKQSSQKFTVAKWSSFQNSQMPNLRLKLRSSDIFSTVLVLKLMKFFDSRRFTQFGQFSFSLSQLISKDCCTQSQPIGLVEKSNKIERNLIGDGQIIGKCSISLQVSFKRFIHQMTNCTQTEDGIISMNHNQLYKHRIKSQQNEYEQLQDMTQSIVYLNQQKIDCSSFYVRSGINNQILELLQRIDKYLNQNIAMSFVYLDRKSKSLRDRKRTMVRVLSVMGCIIEENDIEMDEKCWAIVLAVLKRGQMMLKNWQLTQIDIVNSSNLSKTDQTSQIQISIEYVQAMLVLLKLSLNCDIQHSLSSQDQFSQIFKAYCYFRFPKFRDRIIERISANIEQDKNNNKRHQISRHKQIVGVLSEEIPDQINWSINFWDVLVQTRRGSQFLDRVNSFVDNSVWISQLVASNHLYCNFLKFVISKFCTHKNKLKLPKWAYFEGYSVLVENFLYILSSKQLAAMSNFSLKPMILLLQNEKLSSIIMNILFTKANIFDQSSMLRLAYILSHILHNLSSSCSMKNFPYSVMMKPLKQILQSDHSVSISYFLTLLYTFYTKFEASFRYELSCYLIGKLFWKFSCHWSYHIRKIFFHFLVLKIGQDSQIVESTDIETKLEYVCRILTNLQLYQNDKKGIDYNRIASVNKLHRVMKMKLKQRKQQKIAKQGTQRQQQKLRLQYLCEHRSNQNQIKIVRYNTSPDTKLQKKQSQTEQNYNILQLKSTNRNRNTEQPETQLKLKKKQTYLYHKYTHSCFMQSDFYVPQLDPQTQHSVHKYSSYAVKEVRKLIQQCQEHFFMHLQLPFVEFQFKVDIDQRDFRPDHSTHFS